MVQRFSTQHTRARGSHGNCLRRQWRGPLTGDSVGCREGGQAGSTTMRCDANETCWGNTVLCISRCALWNRNRLFIFRFLVLFFSGFSFSFSCLSFIFVPIWAKSKKSENKHHMHSSSSYRKGEGRRGGLEQLVLYFWLFGNIGEFFLLRAGFLYPNLGCLCLHLRYQPPVSFSPADPHPRAPKAPGTLLPPSSLLVKHAARTRRDGGRGKGGIFIRVVRERRGRRGRGV